MSTKESDLDCLHNMASEFCPKTLLFKTDGHDFCEVYGTQVREHHYYSWFLKKGINYNTFNWLYMTYVNVYMFTTIAVLTIIYG